MRAITTAARTFLVECFAPGIEPSILPEIASAAQLGAEAQRANGQVVDYLGATLVPEDEVVFLHFRAGSAAVVRAASMLVPIPCERVVEAVVIETSTISGSPRESD